MIRSLAKAMVFPAVKQFTAACQNPQAAQQKVWQEVQLAISHGKHWKGSTATLLSDYPMTSYEDYVSSLQESIQSGVSVLQVKRFCLRRRVRAPRATPSYFH